MNDYQKERIIPKDAEYLLFMEPGEKVLYDASGILNNEIQGYLVLTDKRLFFYFVSNISRDKKFIATYPYIVSASLKSGLIYSELTIKNKKESFTIKKVNKKRAKEFYSKLNNIINSNN